MNTVVKSDGQIEQFSQTKLEKSIVHTFKMLKTPDGLIEQFVDRTISEFKDWQKNKPEITSDDIRRQTARILKKIYPDAAYIFKNFKSII